MITINKGTFFVFTYKDGLLSAIAHDLRISLRNFQVTVEENSIKGTFYPESLEVDGAMKNNQLQDGKISIADKQKISKSIQDDVLRTIQYPEINFDGVFSKKSEGVFSISGNLTMVGKVAPISFDISLKNEIYKATISLTPTSWGILPFKALGGALKLKDKVDISFELSP